MNERNRLISVEADETLIQMLIRCGYVFKDIAPEKPLIQPKSVKEIFERSGMNKTEFSKRFGIPYVSLMNWLTESASKRQCPSYVLTMMTEILDIREE